MTTFFRALKSIVIMKKKFCWLLALGAFVLPLAAAPLTESTFTEIIRDVNTLSTAGAAAAASVNDLLRAPDRVRTGAQSRTELTAADHTITRVGANTVFSYADSGRTLNLEKGSLLFHSPKGHGGGTIRSGGASAAVLGTTLIVAATDDGGFKVILLEGRGRVTLPNGEKISLRAGQMVFIAPNGTKTGGALDINLEKLVNGSLLVNGFSRPLPSEPRIAEEIKKQDLLFASGRAVDTGVPADQLAPGNGLNAINSVAYQSGVHPPLTALPGPGIIKGGGGANPFGLAGLGGSSSVVVGFLP